MMGPDKKSIVVRKPDGELEVKTEERKLVKDKYPILGWPLIRGVVNFCLSLYTGVTALMYSSEFYPEDEVEEEPSKFEAWLEKHLGNEKAVALFTTLAVVLGIGFSVVLFILLPTLAAGGLEAPAQAAPAGGLAVRHHHQALRLPGHRQLLGPGVGGIHLRKAHQLPPHHLCGGQEAANLRLCQGVRRGGQTIAQARPGFHGVALAP